MLELYFKYSTQVDEVDVDDLDEDEEDQDEIYLRKLENGLFALQSIVYIIMDIAVNGPSSVNIQKKQTISSFNIFNNRLIDQDSNENRKIAQFKTSLKKKISRNNKRFI